MNESQCDSTATPTDAALEQLRADIAHWAQALGFSDVGFSDLVLDEHAVHLQQWLARGWHGDMRYMARNTELRTEPARLHPGSLRVISVRMDYLSDDQTQAKALLDHGDKAYVSRYALGRDYHKLMRRRLKRLADHIRSEIASFDGRPFVDSAPVLEKALAEKAGLGWIGKHTNLIDKRNGSWFFLGELLINLPLRADTAASNHCGSCRACIDVCPTEAIVGPYQLDARRCISYLTIEHHGDIPEPLRKPMGNRIYGCDDCQLFCPWNKFAQYTQQDDFAPRQGLDTANLADLAQWTETFWLDAMAGSAIRRIGFERWQRNVAVALGNADTSESTTKAIAQLRDSDSAMVARHADWAAAQHATRITREFDS
ncbi:MAG: tRNA epoxyqueuosine(34) reductase QueG [Pseudomonadota bacterium]